MTRALRTLTRAGGIAGLVLLTGCAALDSISGSGTMRIDVEVYKGPLAKDPWTQWGELEGLLEEARISFTQQEPYLWQAYTGASCPLEETLVPAPDPTSTRKTAKAMGVHPSTIVERCGPRTGKESSTAPSGPGIVFKDATQCQLLASLICDINQLGKSRGELGAITRALQTIEIGDAPQLEDTRRRVRRALRDAANLALQLQAKAFFWQGVHVAEPPGRLNPVQGRYARGNLVGFAVLASELANQIATRADALLQQMAGPDRRELPLSVYLRNTTATDFLNLYVWNRAAGPAMLEDWLWDLVTDPPRGRLPRAFTREETADRVRGYERLFGDYNWSNINTVYASGQGDVSMAFVKDDIGNWNLKAFDNDPAELLKAYVDVGKAALAEAASLVKKSSAPGVAVDGASQLVGLANKLAFGRAPAPGATVGGLDVKALHRRTVAQLEGLRAEAAAEAGGWRAQIQGNEKEIARIEAERSEAERQAGAERARLTTSSMDLKVQAEVAERAGEPQRAQDLRGQAKQAEITEARIAKLDGQVKERETTIAGLKDRNQKLTAQIQTQGGAVATRARAILERHRDVVDLLQEGVATGTRGAERSGPSDAVAPR
jgi:hypothetical protein